MFVKEEQEQANNNEVLSEMNSTHSNLNRYYHRQRSEAKLRDLLGPISFSLTEPPIAKHSGQARRRHSKIKREQSISKLRDLLGPVSFNLTSKRQTHAFRENKSRLHDTNSHGRRQISI